MRFPRIVRRMSVHAGQDFATAGHHRIRGWESAYSRNTGKQPCFGEPLPLTDRGRQVDRPAKRGVVTRSTVFSSCRRRDCKHATRRIETKTDKAELADGAVAVAARAPQVERVHVEEVAPKHTRACPISGPGEASAAPSPAAFAPQNTRTGGRPPSTAPLCDSDGDRPRARQYLDTIRNGAYSHRRG
jgi:hypothetical protein